MGAEKGVSEMSKTIHVQAEVKVPSVPNFLLFPAGNISIADITNEGLQEIGRVWTENLIKRAEEIRLSE